MLTVWEDLPDAAASAAGGDWSGRHTVWKKETRDRIKVLKTGLGDSRPPGSKALVSWSDIIFIWCLGKQKVSVVLR